MTTLPLRTWELTCSSLSWVILEGRNSISVVSSSSSTEGNLAREWETSGRKSSTNDLPEDSGGPVTTTDGYVPVSPLQGVADTLTLVRNSSESSPVLPSVVTDPIVSSPHTVPLPLNEREKITKTTSIHSLPSSSSSSSSLSLRQKIEKVIQSSASSVPPSSPSSVSVPSLIPLPSSLWMCTFTDRGRDRNNSSMDTSSVCTLVCVTTDSHRSLPTATDTDPNLSLLETIPSFRWIYRYLLAYPTTNKKGTLSTSTVTTDSYYGIDWCWSSIGSTTNTVNPLSNHHDTGIIPLSPRITIPVDVYRCLRYSLRIQISQRLANYLEASLDKPHYEQMIQQQLGYIDKNNSNNNNNSSTDSTLPSLPYPLGIRWTSHHDMNGKTVTGTTTTTSSSTMKPSFMYFYYPTVWIDYAYMRKETAVVTMDNPSSPILAKLLVHVSIGEIMQRIRGNSHQQGIPLFPSSMLLPESIVSSTASVSSTTKTLLPTFPNVVSPSFESKLFQSENLSYYTPAVIITEWPSYTPKRMNPSTNDGSSSLTTVHPLDVSSLSNTNDNPSRKRSRNEANEFLSNSSKSTLQNSPQRTYPSSLSSVSSSSSSSSSSTVVPSFVIPTPASLLSASLQRIHRISAANLQVLRKAGPLPDNENGPSRTSSTSTVHSTTTIIPTTATTAMAPPERRNPMIKSVSIGNDNGTTGAAPADEIIMDTPTTTSSSSLIPQPSLSRNTTPPRTHPPVRTMFPFSKPVALSSHITNKSSLLHNQVDIVKNTSSSSSSYTGIGMESPPVDTSNLFIPTTLASSLYDRESINARKLFDDGGNIYNNSSSSTTTVRPKLNTLTPLQPLQSTVPSVSSFRSRSNSTTTSPLLVPSSHSNHTVPSLILVPETNERTTLMDTTTSTVPVGRVNMDGSILLPVMDDPSPPSLLVPPLPPPSSSSSISPVNTSLTIHLPSLSTIGHIPLTLPGLNRTDTGSSNASADSHTSIGSSIVSDTHSPMTLSERNTNSIRDVIRIDSNENKINAVLNTSIDSAILEDAVGMKKESTELGDNDSIVSVSSSLSSLTKKVLPPPVLVTEKNNDYTNNPLSVSPLLNTDPLNTSSSSITLIDGLTATSTSGTSRTGSGTNTSVSVANNSSSSSYSSIVRLSIQVPSSYCVVKESFIPPHLAHPYHAIYGNNILLGNSLKLSSIDYVKGVKNTTDDLSLSNPFSSSLFTGTVPLLPHLARILVPSLASPTHKTKEFPLSNETFWSIVNLTMLSMTSSFSSCGNERFCIRPYYHSSYAKDTSMHHPSEYPSSVSYSGGGGTVSAQEKLSIYEHLWKHTNFVDPFLSSTNGSIGTIDPNITNGNDDNETNPPLPSFIHTASQLTNAQILLQGSTVSLDKYLQKFTSEQPEDTPTGLYGLPYPVSLPTNGEDSMDNETKEKFVMSLRSQEYTDSTNLYRLRSLTSLHEYV